MTAKSPLIFTLPHCAGRADYFGALPNLAARLMSLAQPGQVLVHGNLGSMPNLRWLSEDHSTAVLVGKAGEVELSQLGLFSVKVREASIVRVHSDVMGAAVAAQQAGAGRHNGACRVCTAREPRCR